ncbi:MAG TPA: hypothetical protein PLM87_05000, partial [Bacteroidales bacterium]|nr:hypothetical protein [Bacteroidales bacterium]
MKTIKFLLLFIVGVMISSCTINNYYTQSQPYDDVYYNPNIHQYPDNNVQNQDYQQQDNQYQDYQYQDNQEYYQDQSNYSETYTDDNGNTYITNNYYGDYYDYSYSSRIRRFYYPELGFGYYDPWYTNIYWYTYDPWYFGISVYLTYPFWRPGISFYWGYYPFNYYTGWYHPYHYGWGYPGYWYGYNYGYWHGYNHGYWDGFWTGYYDGFYGSEYYYYNPFDVHSGSVYYGPRDYVSASTSGRTNRTINETQTVLPLNRTVATTQTFSERLSRTGYKPLDQVSVNKPTESLQKQNDNNVIQSGGNTNIDNLQKKPLENNANPATSITNQAIKQENKDNTQLQINKPLNNQTNISQPTQIQKQPTQQNIQSQPIQQRPPNQPTQIQKQPTQQNIQSQPSQQRPPNQPTQIQKQPT